MAEVVKKEIILNDNNYLIYFNVENKDSYIYIKPIFEEGPDFHDKFSFFNNQPQILYYSVFGLQEDQYHKLKENYHKFHVLDARHYQLRELVLLKPCEIQVKENSFYEKIFEQVRTLDMQDILVRVKEIFKSIDVEIDEDICNIVNNIFQITRLNMRPGIEILKYQAKFSTYERGQLLYEYRTEDEREIIYYILDICIPEVIMKDIKRELKIMESAILWEKYNTENKERRTTIFNKIGEPYKKWNEDGRNHLNM